MSTPKRGLLIVIEGLDKAGKSTQALTLHSRLQAANVPVKLMKMPDRTTPIGKMIDSYLKSDLELDDRAIHLLFAANRWELSDVILNTLAEGSSIICDRYSFSGVAYSVAKGLPFEWCRAPEISLPAPDITFFLDISPEKARLRGAGYGEERYEKEELQRRVREIFMKIGSDTSAAGVGRWLTLDAGRAIEDVENDIRHDVDALLGSDRAPIGKLWVRD